jgi:hypothetical protein
LLHFGKLFTDTRELFIRSGDLFVRVREPFIGARDQLYVLPGQSRTSIVWIVGLLGVRQGIHGRLFPVLPSTEWAIVAVLTLRTAALTKARLEDGKYRADFGHSPSGIA